MPPRRAAHVAWRKIGDETVVMNLRARMLVGLNPAGGFLWHALDGQRGVDDLAELVAQAGGREAVEPFLGRLRDAGLLAGDGDPPEAAAVPQPYPSPGTLPPEVVWTEEVRLFGFSCAFMPTQNPTCDSAPTG